MDRVDRAGQAGERPVVVQVVAQAAVPAVAQAVAPLEAAVADQVGPEAPGVRGTSSRLSEQVRKWLS